MELEHQLQEQLRDKTRAVVMLQCGIRAQGKTTKMTAILRWCLDNNCMSEYWLIAPSFARDANHGYAWLSQPQYRKERFASRPGGRLTRRPVSWCPTTPACWSTSHRDG